MTTVTISIAKRKAKGNIFYKGKLTVLNDGEYLYSVLTPELRMKPGDALNDADLEVMRVIREAKGLDIVKV